MAGVTWGHALLATHHTCPLLWLFVRAWKHTYVDTKAMRGCSFRNKHADARSMACHIAFGQQFTNTCVLCLYFVLLMLLVLPQSRTPL